MSLDEILGSSCTGSGSYLRTCRIVFVGAVVASGGIGALVGRAVRSEEPPGSGTRILVGSALGAAGAFVLSTLACEQEDTSNPEVLCGYDGMVTTRSTLGMAALGAVLGGVLGGGSAPLQVGRVGVVPRPGGSLGVEAAFRLPLS